MSVTPSIFLDDYPFPRPADIPEDWQIWNAPRSLYGHKEWTGGFCRGIFYAAIDPSDPDAERLTNKNLELDGHPCRWVTMDEIRQWARGYYVPMNINPDDFDDDDVVRAYVHHMG